VVIFLLEPMIISVVIGGSAMLLRPLYKRFSKERQMIKEELASTLMANGIYSKTPKGNKIYSKVGTPIKTDWGYRCLVTLPRNKSSNDIVYLKQIIREVLNQYCVELHIYFNKCLVIDLIEKEKKSDPLPFEVEKKGFLIPIGTTLTGEVVYLDLLGTHPHIIVAGATGTGKSMVLRNILLSLASLKNTPDFYLCDMKGGVELGAFKDLLSTKGFGTDLKSLLSIAKNVQGEMYRRLNVMATNNIRTWQGNFVFLAMDEMIDLKNVAHDSKENKQLKTQIKVIMDDIAAKGRASRIWLLCATQRPDAQVINGNIKGQITNKICLFVETDVDSRVVLDHTRASELPNVPGRFIYRRGKEQILQGFVLDDDELDEKIMELPRKIATEVRREVNEEFLELKGVTTNEHAPEEDPEVEGDTSFY
jgi:DNA segregation ATPase FtsK/SpoIIIE-like protein